MTPMAAWLFRLLTLEISAKCSLLDNRRERVLDLLFQFVAGVECHDPAGFDGDGLTGAGIASGSRRFGADLEIAKT